MSQYTILQYWKKISPIHSSLQLSKIRMRSIFIPKFILCNCFVISLQYHGRCVPDSLHFIVHKLKLRQAYTKSTHHELSMNYKV